MTFKKGTGEYLALALSGGEELLRKRTVTTMGIRFPAEPYPGKLEIRYELKLYDGAAGIGITLLDLYQATGDPRYTGLCEEISHGLIESTPEYGLLRPGLYGGFSGVALFHLACARILQKRDALDRARRANVAAQNAVRLAIAHAHVEHGRPDSLDAGLQGRGLNHVRRANPHALAAFHAAAQEFRFLRGAGRADAPGGVVLRRHAAGSDGGIEHQPQNPRQRGAPGGNLRRGDFTLRAGQKAE